jgi:hypothetical protein
VEVADSGPRLEAALVKIIKELEGAARLIARRASNDLVSDDGNVAGAIEAFVREIRDAIREEVHAAEKAKERDRQGSA